MAQIFPKWTNNIPKVILPILLGVVSFVIFAFWYWGSPYNLDVGYQPEQPVPYSHKLHVGQLGMDCRYCHYMVEKSAVAGVPPTEVCMNCHATVKTESFKLAEVMKSWKTGDAIPWVRIHKVPDYAYFDHSVHIARGVSCVECHGRVDQMETVKQVEPLSMGWCLNCHRNPAQAIRPKDKITDLGWKPTAEWKAVASAHAKNIHPPVESCTGCHR